MTKKTKRKGIPSRVVGVKCVSCFRALYGPAQIPQGYGVKSEGPMAFAAKKKGFPWVHGYCYMITDFLKTLIIR